MLFVIYVFRCKTYIVSVAGVLTDPFPFPGNGNSSTSTEGGRRTAEDENDVESAQRGGEERHSEHAGPPTYESIVLDDDPIATAAASGSSLSSPAASPSPVQSQGETNKVKNLFSHKQFNFLFLLIFFA